jgi:hypothetical protein
VPTTRLTVQRSVPVADVGSLDALVDLAEKYESMIMENKDVDGSTYLLWDDGMLYRYTIGTPTTESPTQLLEDDQAAARLVVLPIVMSDSSTGDAPFRPEDFRRELE